MTENIPAVLHCSCVWRKKEKHKQNTALYKMKHWCYKEGTYFLRLKTQPLNCLWWFAFSAGLFFCLHLCTSLKVLLWKSCPIAYLVQLLHERLGILCFFSFHQLKQNLSFLEALVYFPLLQYSIFSLVLILCSLHSLKVFQLTIDNFTRQHMRRDTDALNSTSGGCMVLDNYLYSLQVE